MSKVFKFVKFVLELLLDVLTFVFLELLSVIGIPIGVVAFAFSLIASLVDDVFAMYDYVSPFIHLKMFGIVLFNLFLYLLMIIGSIIIMPFLFIDDLYTNFINLVKVIFEDFKVIVLDEDE